MQGICIFQRYIWRLGRQQYTVWLYSWIKLLLGLYSKKPRLKWAKQSRYDYPPGISSKLACLYVPIFTRLCLSYDSFSGIMTTREGVLSATGKARNLHLCIVRAVLQFLGAVILFALGQLGNLSFAYKSYAGHPPWISQVQSIGLPIIFLTAQPWYSLITNWPYELLSHSRW